jgi:hypothetical protein
VLGSARRQRGVGGLDLLDAFVQVPTRRPPRCRPRRRHLKGALTTLRHTESALSRIPRQRGLSYEKVPLPIPPNVCSPSRPSAGIANCGSSPRTVLACGLRFRQRALDARGCRRRGRVDSAAGATSESNLTGWSSRVTPFNQPRRMREAQRCTSRVGVLCFSPSRFSVGARLVPLGCW